MAPGNSKIKRPGKNRSGDGKADKTRADIRLRILKFVKTAGRAQIGEVAKHLRITHEGARKHLILMEKSGWVGRNEQVTQAAEIGRPKDSFSVTASGDRQFPKAYDRLSLAILSALKDAGGSETLRKILSILAQNQADAWAPRL